MRKAGVSVAALALGALAEDGFITIDMYRGMSAGGVTSFKEENDDLADLLGVIKYIHTEVIVEHTMSPPERTYRKNGIDVIGKWDMKVLNPLDLRTSQECLLVDFGQFLAYDNGQQTAAVGDELIANYGDFVGIQDQSSDTRFPTETPYYWYSLSGFCPNLPWHCTRGYEGCEHPSPPSNRCTEDKPCPGKGTRSKPNENCSTYLGGQIVKGGLCPDGKDPDGTLGCAYSYDDKARVVVSLDELVGITEEDCGGKKCKDWLTWRRECTNQSYMKKFGEKNIETVSYCVEYDIHPDCLANCSAPKCLKVPVDQREVGLPWWQGRCDAKKNQERGERFAAALGIQGATDGHILISQAVVNGMQSCAERVAGHSCQPDSKTGGPYCSRVWTGVCTPCWIPGTIDDYPSQTQPTCPVDILKTSDYDAGSIFIKPQCKTQRPRDLCCIYTGRCDGEMDPAKAPLDDDGLVVNLATRDTRIIMNFYERIAADEKMGKYVEDPLAFEQFAYQSWHLGLTPGTNFNKTAAAIKRFFGNASPPPTPAPTPHGGGDNGGHFPIAVVVIALVVLGLGVAAAAAFFVRRKNQRAQRRNRLLAGQA